MKNLSTILTCMILCMISFTVMAQQPSISIQGTLKDASGAAVSDGNYMVEFRLYHSSTGGTVQWSEEAQVEVTGGIYSHYLGSVTPLNEAIFSQTLYMGVKVGSFELVPRTELTYAPYTFAADRVSCSGALGDVKYSILDPTQFAAVNGDCWVPLDGGDMTGSQLAGIIGGTNVPDMSGLFIRAAEYNEGNDPDRTLSSPIATVQNDEFKAHNHTAGTLITDTKTLSTSDQYVSAFYVYSTDCEDNSSCTQSGGSLNGNNSRTIPGVNDWDYDTYRIDSYTATRTSSHNHTITGNTADQGGSETRSKNMNFYIYIRIN